MDCVSFIIIVAVHLPFFVQNSFKRAAHEREVRNMAGQMSELERQREAAIREGGELKMQLKLVEEARDNLRRELLEAGQRLRDLDEVRHSVN